MIHFLVFERLTYKTMTVGLLFSLVSLSAVCSEHIRDGASTTNDLYYETLTLRYQPPSNYRDLAELAEKLGYLKPIKLERITPPISEAHSIQAVLGGDADFGSAFNGLIVKSRLNGAPIKAVVGAYVDEVFQKAAIYLPADSLIMSIHDLTGKTIAIENELEQPIFVMKAYFDRNGLDKTFTDRIEWIIKARDEIMEQIERSQIDAALLIESPDTTIPVKRLRAADLSNNEIAAGSYFFTESFLKKNPHTMEKFVEAIASTIEWLRHTQPNARHEQNMPESAGVAFRLGGLLDDELFSDWITRLTAQENKPTFNNTSVREYYDNQFNPYLYGSPTLKRQAESIL